MSLTDTSPDTKSSRLIQTSRAKSIAVYQLYLRQLENPPGTVPK